MKLKIVTPIRLINTTGAVKATQRGFTLIELMIVVVIIGMLSMIAYPSYQHYVQQTNRKAAIAEMHIIGQALGRYYNHHNGTYDDGIEPANKNANIERLVSKINDRIQGYNVSVRIDVTPANFGQAYTIIATQDSIGGDPDCGDLTIDSYGNKTSSKGSHCFR